MIRYVYSSKLAGIDGRLIKIECDVQDKGIGIHVVGLADITVKEALLRTVTALQAYGCRIPGRKVVINLQPMDVRKGGCGYDLPIALSVIAASGQDDHALDDLEKWVVVGELGLDGSVRAVPGCVQALEVAWPMEDVNGIIVPKANVPELAPFVREGFPVYGVEALSEAVAVIRGDSGMEPLRRGIVLEKHVISSKSVFENEFVGNETAQRALVIAAAGGHHLIAMGAPGCGKAKLAKALIELLPAMEDRLTVAKVYSAMGKTQELVSLYENGLNRPCRNPHYSSSMVTMFGGGSGDSILPGEVTLAHEGVLHLDEIECLPRSVADTLGHILEDKEITIARLNARYLMPAGFQLVSSLSPCPCGYYGEGERCTCSPATRTEYLAKSLNNEVFRHSDLQVFMRVVSDADIDRVRLHPMYRNESVGASRLSVARARKRQKSRNPNGKLNVELTEREILAIVDDKLSQDTKAFLETVIQRLGLTSRSIGPLLRVARTIADLAGKEEISASEISEAASYRFLDRDHE